ncbi:hypothetical protein JCM8097_000892 [Rhodosporidiobolus ruineniae]
MLRLSRNPLARSLTPLRHPLGARAFRPSSSSLFPTTTSSSSSRFAPYLAQLHVRYPNTSPASLTASFLVLHELTALVPLGVLFAAFSAAGVGSGIVAWAVDESSSPSSSAAEPSSLKRTLRSWLEESEDKAERVGRRYGLFGWEKETAGQRARRREEETAARERGEEKVRELKVGGAVGDAVAAYLVTKALLPLRILVSLRLAPTLANGVVGRWKARRAAGKAVEVGRRG